MKITVLKDELKDSVSLASHFVNPKQQLPILGNIYLKAEKNRLIINSTNLESSFSTSIGAKIVEEGEVTVSGRTLNDVVSNLNEDTVEILVEKEQLRISGTKNKTSLVGTNSSDFPKINADSGSGLCVLKLSDFNKAVSKILFSVSHDETRPSLTGIYFSFIENVLSLVSTDGFRLSKMKIPLKEKAGEISFIVPRFVLSELLKASGEDLSIKYDQENKLVIFSINETYFVSRLIEGTFPDYEKIIPTKFVLDFDADRLDLERSVKSASVFSRDASNIIKLKTLENLLSVSSESSASGSQETFLEIKKGENKLDLELLFNYKFIEDLLKVVEDEFVTLFVSGSNTACMFLDKKDTNFLHLIMPIKTS